MVFKCYQKIENFALRIIEKLENQKITMTGWLVSFFAIVFLRALLESFSSRFYYLHSGGYPFLFFHHSAFFLVFALFVILFLYFLTKEKIEKISKISLFGFLIILPPPIIDLIVTQGRGWIMVCYAGLPESLDNISNFFQSFLRFILYNRTGTLFYMQEPSFLYREVSWMSNVGIRITSSILFLGFIWYIFLKTKNIFKVFLGLLVLYFAIFTFGVFPLGFYKFSSSLNPSFVKHFVIFSLYLILICFLATIWFYIYNKEKFFAFFRNSRPLRTIHNIALLGFGLYLARVPIFQPFSLNFFDWLLIATAAVSLLLYWLSAVGYDDLADEKIDKISNPSRPLPQGKFKRGEFRALSDVLRMTSFVTAFVVGYGFFVFLLLRSLVAYLYSNSPFRLKRFPVIATFTRGLAFLFTIYGGFLINSENTIYDFPQKLALFLLLAFTLGITVKDIRDYEGDKADGVYTIPVIFGPEKGKKIIGTLVFIVFILCPLFFFTHFKILILPSILAGALSFYLIQCKISNWKYLCLFLIYFSYGLLFALTF